MHTSRLAGPAAVLAILLVSAGPALANPSDTHPANGPDQPDGPSVIKTTMLGPVHQNGRVDARDNGQSVLYRGKSMWFFDDTILQEPFGFLSSTAAITADLDASDGIELTSSNVFEPDSTGEPTDFVPYTAAEQAFQTEHAADDCTDSPDEYCGTVFGLWPGAAVVDPARHRILVSYGKLCRGGQDGTPCESGFVGQGLGAGFAEVDMRTKTVSRLVAQNRTTDLPSPEGKDDTMFFPLDDDWGGAGLVRRGNTVYAYGKCSLDGCAVAKAPLNAFQDLSRWRYYAGDQSGQARWATDPEQAVVVVGNGAAGGTVTVDQAFGGYVHTYMPFLSQDVLYQTAPHPWGPWSKPATLFTAPKTEGVDYAAFAHPEFDSSDGRTKYYTYYSSLTGDQMLVRVDFATGE